MAAMAANYLERRPLGVRLIQQYVVRRKVSFEVYQMSVLIVTFIAYSLYHLSRKPSSIVKNTLISLGHSHIHSHHYTFYRSPHSNIHSNIAHNLTHLGILHQPNATTFASHKGSTLSAPPPPLKGWAPFDGDSGAALMGDIDVAFLAMYAIGTFFAGHLGDRLCLRWFLAVGMVGSGIFTGLFGLAYWWNVHWLPYFFLVQMLLGLFQATGWPSVVSVVAKWFGKRKRGLIMGVWNAHTSFGNICGSLIASSMLDEGWGWAFLVPGMAVMAGGVLVFLFLIVDPTIVGFPSPHTQYIHERAGGERRSCHYNEMGADEEAPMYSNPLAKKGFCEAPAYEGHGKLVDDQDVGVDQAPLLERYIEVGSSMTCDEVHAVSFLDALAIPGVVPFSLCLFFAKLVAYTFIYWLPFYISNTEIGGEDISDEVAGNLSTLFDVGGVVGGIVAGHMSDRLNARAMTAALFTWGAIPAMVMYRAFGGVSLSINVGLLLLAGLFVNGPYSLITTAVSADLGMHERVKGNARALATVAAIIDGTGSMGAALGPLFTGYISEAFGWDAVFAMLTLSAFVSGVLLIKQVSLELRSRSSTRR